MPCTHPILLRIPGRFHLVENRLTDLYEVPCGKCADCRIKRTKQWSLRCLMEFGYHKKASFITLTYDEKFLPFNCGVPTLVPKHLTDFFKRLRKYFDDGTVKYFSCGEYGTKFKRPHYHAIVFGVGFEDIEIVRKCWKYGFISSLPVNPATCSYVAGYCQKKLFGDLGKIEYQYKVPPFQRSSINLGLQFLIDNFNKILEDGSIKVFGHSYPIPRYFWNKFKDQEFLNKVGINFSSTYFNSIKNNFIDHFLVARDIRYRKMGFNSLPSSKFMQRELDQHNINLVHRLELSNRDKEF